VGRLTFDISGEMHTRLNICAFFHRVCTGTSRFALTCPLFCRLCCLSCLSSCSLCTSCLLCHWLVYNCTVSETCVKSHDESHLYAVYIEIRVFHFQSPWILTVNNSVQFSSLLLVCCINSQKANYRCSTREDKIINITK
jgi:hypothetical protein